MDRVVMDAHKKDNQPSILTDGSEIIERRIRTEPECFAAVPGTRSCVRIIEAGTHSDWVARRLEREVDFKGVRRNSSPSAPTSTPPP